MKFRNGRHGAKTVRMALLLGLSGLCVASTNRSLAGSDEVDALGRRVPTGQTTTLAFDGVTLDRLIPFIVESTGKVVIPQPELLNRRITIINDKPIPQMKALDLVFLALQQQGIAVVETREIITLRDISEIVRQDVPVIGPNESVLDRTDYGTIAEKVYALRNSSAKTLQEMLKSAVPDYARLGIDEQSNQIIVLGNIALLQRIERLVDSLDRPSAAALSTETFRLRYADAERVAQNIKDLFEDTSARTSTGRTGNNPFAAFQVGGRGGRGGGQQEAESAAAPTQNLRVTANTQQNSVTVLAEPAVLEQIRRQIVSVWDQPLPEEAVIPKIYDLQHSDPIKVRDLLEGLFGSASTEQQSQASQGVGRLRGQFSFEAIPEASRLVVVAKSPDNMFVIDQIIEGIDQPQHAGLPELVELKHASAEELSEQLNSLLAEEGTLAQIRRAESGLSERSASSSPFAEESTAATGQDQIAPDTMTFWWQRARPPASNRGASNLVGRIRLVPVWRQNAVMVLSPPEYRSSVVELIRDLDRPGRQVLIKAVIAEISLEDATSLGLRWSNQPIQTNLSDNVFNLGTTTTAQETNFLGNLFDTSVLDATVNLNILLQALAQTTAINILSEPRIFTSDNQEAEFFDGQDIPFVTDTQTTDSGNVIESFDYRAVGIQLRVRPRITVNRDVDLRVNLELSSIQPQATLFGGFIVDRRETTTQLIVRDGQTIVISGILRSEDSNVLRKVPLLGDIPLLGLLFQSTDKVIRNTELVAFITPVVVDNEVDLDRVNDPYRERLNELRDLLGGERENQMEEDAERLRESSSSGQTQGEDG